MRGEDDGARVTLRFYGPLNDFLPPPQRQRPCLYHLHGATSVKDFIESRGVPHTEVALILVNGRPVGFGHRVAPGDRISVYPRFRSLLLPKDLDLQSPVPAPHRFIVDANLGKLASHLRLCGFDTLYRSDYDDREIARIASEQGRILLTRDRQLPKRSHLRHAYFVRATQPRRQLSEVMAHFDLAAEQRPFTRCLRCNGPIEAVPARAVQDSLPPRTHRYYQSFWRCRDCGRVYWKGPHYMHMLRFLRGVMDSCG